MFGLGKQRMVSGDSKKIRIKTGYNRNEKNFFIQMTELKYDKDGKKYAGQEMRVNLDEEFYKNLANHMKAIHQVETHPDDYHWVSANENKDS